MLNTTRVAAIAALASAGAANAAISLDDTQAYTQNFNTLATTGTANNALPAGWVLSESGNGARDNEAYGADTGTTNTGDIYSFGNNADRALGSIRSGTLIPLYGASFTNAGASSIESLAISYYGEQWRYGATGRSDVLSFQYSLDATSLTTGTWTTISSLGYTAPNTGSVGARDGNLAANRSLISGTIADLNIATGSTFWIRYNDIDVAGAEDGLAVDDFQLAATFAPQAPVPEPGEWAMMAAGLGVAGFAAKRRKKA